MPVRSVLGNICCGVRGNVYCGPSQARTERLLAQITLGPSSAAAYRRGGGVCFPKAKYNEEKSRKAPFFFCVCSAAADRIMLQSYEISKIFIISSDHHALFF